ncbi:NUDIX hydrolase [Siculibacillus lacustris]|uniref:NUDIX hydrolase n=1 Tax=Siculibacillus lacustris TaxID=1549641 RepID=A0A4Q9VGW5_9HYPH|nr:NUDIX hydrolase [Siculibacillus lacustris]TBW34300.1 NUDIX hydrolase [Siculibacillus lacustris]
MRSDAEILDELNALDRSRKAPPYRPRDAATLIVIDGAGDDLKVLMGRRHLRHRFMPGALVFPGGRVDPGDSRVRLADDYDPRVLAALRVAMHGPKTAARTRAFAVAAIRETWEETGVLIGTAAAGSAAPLGAAAVPLPDAPPPDPHDAFAVFAARQLRPSLTPMRFIARAITPPGRPRRFDTRFLAVPASAIAGRSADGLGPSGELEEVAFVTLAEARAHVDLAPITRAVLDELERRLAVDPGLDGAAPVPFYRWARDRFVREEITGESAS